MAFAHADELPVGERMEGVGHADKLHRSAGKVCFQWRVTSDLEEGSFRWPTLRDGVMRLTPAQLSALLEGLDWARVRGVRMLTPKAVS